MRSLLNARHWQIFLLTIGLIILVNYAGSVAGRATHQFGPARILGSQIAMVIYMCALLGWIRAIVFGLQSHIPPGAEINTGIFRILSIVPFVFIFAFAVMVSFKVMAPGLIHVTNPVAVVILFVLFPVFSMFCIFYSMYYSAKALKSVELQRRVNFGDCFGEIFLTWFFPIGVWILQPRINRIVAESKEKQD